MAGQRVSFGRRGASRPQPRAALPLPGTPAKTAESGSASLGIPPRAALALPSADDELRDWKRERRQHYALPWRQISLMAGLCFGLGSLILPASVNGAVNWLLYGLAGASLVAGLRRRAR